MHTIKEAGSLNGKRIIARVDFDVTIKSSATENKHPVIVRIEEPFRIERQKKTIDFLLSEGAKIGMVAHVSGIDSFAPIVEQIAEILGHKIKFCKTIEEFHSADNDLFLLEDVRSFKGEKENNLEFAKNLSSGFDLYVNNAFAVCHRKHASVSAISECLPAYAGFLLEEETVNLEKAINTPKEGKILIMGGAKASTKVPVIKNFLNRADKILVGGALANNFFKIRGFKIGSSRVDDSVVLSFLENQSFNGDDGKPKIVLPYDIVVSKKAEDYEHVGARISLLKDIGFGHAIVDMGPESVKRFNSFISEAKFIIWNGPMGLTEFEEFAKSTIAIAEAIVSSRAFKIVGGGDTIAILSKISVLDKFDFVSTGGGAMLSFLAGNKLPGLRALGYHDEA